MSTEPLPTPMELAHLSAALVQAGMLPQSDSRSGSNIVAALAYWRLCADTLHDSTLIAEADGLKKEIAAEREKFFSRFPSGNVSVEAIVRQCNAHRIKLNADELRGIGERRQWEHLSEKDRLEAIFLALTNYPPAPFDPAIPLAERRESLANLRTSEDATREMRHIRTGMRQRQSATGKLGAEIKRRKPRTPRGDGPGFEGKARHPETKKYIRQKK